MHKSSSNATMRCFNDALRIFKSGQRGNIRNQMATTLWELTQENSNLLSLIDEGTQIKLRFYWR